MSQLMILRLASREETILTHVEVEAFQATVPASEIILTLVRLNTMSYRDSHSPYEWTLKSYASHLNPMIGYSLQILHLAWCFAVSAADSLCSTGSHTILCGSCCSQLKKCTASISFLSFPAFSKQLRTLGSMFDPPNAATSPNCLGTCMQSCNSSPSLRWSTSLLGSAIRRNRSRSNEKEPLNICHEYIANYQQAGNLHILLTSILFFQMSFAQQDQSDFERKYSNLAGSLAENCNMFVKFIAYILKCE